MKLLARIAVSSMGVITGVVVGGGVGFFGLMLLGWLISDGTDPGTWIFVLFTVPLGMWKGGVAGGRPANRLTYLETPVLDRLSPGARWGALAFISGVSGYVTGGFIAGMTSIEDPFAPRNPLTYAASGFYGAITFIGRFGRALALDGDRPINAWPHFFVCWFVFLSAIAYWTHKARSAAADE